MAVTDPRGVNQGKSNEDAIFVDSSTDDSLNTSTDSDVQVIAVVAPSDEKKTQMTIKDFKEEDNFIEGSDEKEKFSIAVAIMKSLLAGGVDPNLIPNAEKLVEMMNQQPGHKYIFVAAPNSRLLHYFKAVVGPHAKKQMDDEKKKEEEKKAAEKAEDDKQRENAVTEVSLLNAKAAADGAKAHADVANLCKDVVGKLNI